MRAAVVLLTLAALAPSGAAGLSGGEQCGEVAPLVTRCTGAFAFEGQLGIQISMFLLGEVEVRLEQPGRTYVLHCGAIDPYHAGCGETGLPPLPGVPTQFACEALPHRSGLGPLGAWGCGFSWG